MTTTTLPPCDAVEAARIAAAERAIEETIRDFVRMWKEQGRVLDPDDPLRMYWPTDDGRAS